ncbi:hypothetical protein ACIBCO_40720 [Streptomyces violascens]|uniref:DUF7683 domain-containing protein n=1 Tax=Streptomyces violascens TaxID=67381 RepID=UPI0037AAD8AC
MSFVITSYKNGEDRPDEETDVSHLGADFIATVLGMKPEQLTDVYLLTQRHADLIGPPAGMSFDLATHDYHLEALADD